jgi:DNA-binding IclR family transcriptional regulator
VRAIGITSSQGGPALEVFSPSDSITQKLPLRQELQQDVTQRIGDTLFLTARTGLDTLCVARRLGSYPIQVLSIEVGARRPLGVSSAGVAILAAMAPPEARKIVPANQARFEPCRTNPTTVLAQIADARRRGYGVRDIGLVQGTKSISAWIRSPDNQPAAAITITAIRHRLSHRREGRSRRHPRPGGEVHRARIVMKGSSKSAG